MYLRQGVHIGAMRPVLILIIATTMSVLKSAIHRTFGIRKNRSSMKIVVLRRQRLVRPRNKLKAGINLLLV